MFKLITIIYAMDWSTQQLMSLLSFHKKITNPTLGILQYKPTKIYIRKALAIY